METYHGHVRTPADAIILFEACRLGLLPRVQRRLSEKERRSIKSGSVFVWDEREAGMRRWTDGKSWSASRVSGSFLTYREMEGKRGGGGGGGGGFAPSMAAAQSRAGKTPESTRGSDSDVDMGDEGPDGYRYKPDGLMKQSFSITTSSGAHLHLISYYSRSHPSSPTLNQPSTDHNLRNIRPQKGLYPESTVHDPQNGPAVTRGPMPGSSYASSPHGVQTAGPPGYARSGATHPLSYAFPPGPAYGWPPSPASTPPATYPMGPHGPPQQTSTPNGGGAAFSPLQYGQNVSPNHGGPTNGAFDTLPPPISENNHHHHNNNHRPPPSHHHHRSSGSPNGSAQPRNFIPHQSSPRIAQAALAAQQQADQAKIDPRLTALSGPSPIANHAPLRTPPASSRNLEKFDVNPPPPPPRRESNGASANNSIPGIGTLMNGAAAAAAAGGSTGDATAKNADSIKRDRGSGGGDDSRSGSRSPGGTKKKKSSGPQDIPSEKLGFGEDVRALRVLDGRFLHSG